MEEEVELARLAHGGDDVARPERALLSLAQRPLAGLLPRALRHRLSHEGCEPVAQPKRLACERRAVALLQRLGGAAQLRRRKVAVARERRRAIEPDGAAEAGGGRERRRRARRIGQAHLGSSRARANRLADCLRVADDGEGFRELDEARPLRREGDVHGGDLEAEAALAVRRGDRGDAQPQVGAAVLARDVGLAGERRQLHARRHLREVLVHEHHLPHDEPGLRRR